MNEICMRMYVCLMYRVVCHVCMREARRQHHEYIRGTLTLMWMRDGKKERKKKSRALTLNTSLYSFIYDPVRVFVR